MFDRSGVSWGSFVGGVVAVVLALLLAVASTIPASAAEGGAAGSSDAPRPGLTVRLVDPPIDPDDPRSLVYVVGHHQPGEVLRRTIEVANGDDVAVDVRLGVADADAGDDWQVEGGWGTGDVARWTQLSSSSVRLGPGERRQVGVTITIPDDAFGGERYGVILAERSLPGNGATEVIGRVGIRTYLSVGGAEAPPTDFTIDTMRPLRLADGRPAVWIGVTNTGERVIDVAGELALREGPAGLSAGPFPVVVPRTLGPGHRGEVVVELDRSLPDGPWLAIATLRGGPVERSAQARLTFPVASGQGPGTGSGSGSGSGDTVVPADADQEIGPNGEVLGDPVPAEPFIDREVLLPFNLLLLLLAVVGTLVARQALRRQEAETHDRADPTSYPR